MQIERTEKLTKPSFQQRLSCKRMHCRHRPNDTVFVALASHFDSKLWTGDKELPEGLRAKGYEHVITSAKLFALFEELEQST